MQTENQPQTAQENRPVGAVAAPAESDVQSASASPYRVIRRNGKLTHFDASKITVAMTKAFLAVEGGNAAASSRIHETVADLTGKVVDSLFRRLPDGGTVHIEDIQDQVELALMRAGDHKVARSYVLYREQQAAQARRRGRQERAQGRRFRAATSRWPTAAAARSTRPACAR